MSDAVKAFDEARSQLGFPDQALSRLGKGTSGEDNTQKAARLASAYIERAIKTVGGILDNPERYSQVQIQAARLILELSAELKPEAEAEKTQRAIQITSNTAVTILQARGVIK